MGTHEQADSRFIALLIDAYFLLPVECSYFIPLILKKLLLLLLVQADSTTLVTCGELFNGLMKYNHYSLRDINTTLLGNSLM